MVSSRIGPQLNSDVLLHNKELSLVFKLVDVQLYMDFKIVKNEQENEEWHSAWGNTFRREIMEKVTRP